MFGESDGVLVVGQAAAKQQAAAWVHIDDGARAVQRPFDAPTGQRPTRRVRDRGDQNLFGAARRGHFRGPHIDAHGERIEAGEKANGARLGGRGRGVGRRRSADERSGRACGAGASGQTNQAGRQQQERRQRPSALRHWVALSPVTGGRK